MAGGIDGRGAPGLAGGAGRGGALRAAAALQRLPPRRHGRRKGPRIAGRRAPPPIHTLQQVARSRLYGVDVKVMLTPPCIFCMDNHQ
jgi:hypothetical protein